MVLELIEHFTVDGERWDGHRRPPALHIGCPVPSIGRWCHSPASLATRRSNSSHSARGVLSLTRYHVHWSTHASSSSENLRRRVPLSTLSLAVCSAVKSRRAASSLACWRRNSRPASRAAFHANKATNHGGAEAGSRLHRFAVLTSRRVSTPACRIACAIRRVGMPKQRDVAIGASRRSRLACSVVITTFLPASPDARVAWLGDKPPPASTGLGRCQEAALRLGNRTSDLACAVHPAPRSEHHGWSPPRTRRSPVRA